MISDPPRGISSAARRLASTNDQALISMERRKLALVVFSTNEPLSSFLSEKAMAWTRKSTVPNASFTAAKAPSMLASSVTSQGTKVFTPRASPRGRTRRSMASM